MLKTIIIIATAASMLVGSFGVTSIEHVCTMMGVMKRVDAACGMCSHRESSHGDEISATPCCSFTYTVHRTSDSVLTRVELPAPILQSAFLPTAVARLLEIHAQPVATVPTSESPPDLALRGQSTYLVNSVFLI
jgi:hypothetical protein